MRWEKRAATRPQAGERREVLRFLLIPREICGQWRWLEFAKIRQERYLGWSSMPEGPVYRSWKWRDVEWVD